MSEAVRDGVSYKLQAETPKKNKKMSCPPQKKIFFRIQKALLIRIKIKLEVSLLAKRQSPELQKSSNDPC